MSTVVNHIYNQSVQEQVIRRRPALAIQGVREAAPESEADTLDADLSRVRQAIMARFPDVDDLFAVSIRSSSTQAPNGSRLNGSTSIPISTGMIISDQFRHQDDQGRYYHPRHRTHQTDLDSA